jgi:L-fuconolactonase
MGFTCIDAHQHLWRYLPPGPAWMGNGMEVLRRDFLFEDLRAVTTEASVTGTIVVETERTIEETEWLSEVAASTNLICGVVGWAPLTSPAVVLELERLVSLPKMKALRHPIHDEPDDQFVFRDDFNRGVSALKQFNLGYDILIFERHLPQTIQFVDRHPDQIFVLDHVAKPRIREHVLSPWRENIQDLARRPNVYCKISGMVTEADWDSWSDEGLAPYIDTVLEAFSPKRLMFGSDWPVMTLASSYRRWMGTVRIAIAQLSRAERERILSGTAVEAYGLTLPGNSINDQEGLAKADQ